MSTSTYIAVHLVPPEEMPPDADATCYVRERGPNLFADFYCSSASPLAARAYVADLITRIRRTELAL